MCSRDTGRSSGEVREGKEEAQPSQSRLLYTHYHFQSADNFLRQPLLLELATRAKKPVSDRDQILSPVSSSRHTMRLPYGKALEAVLERCLSQVTEIIYTHCFSSCKQVATAVATGNRSC